MFQIKTIFAALFVALFFTGCATKTAEVADFSGYIGDYDGLEKTTDELGHEVLRWRSSDLIPGAYESLMMDEIVFYPAPKATPQISEELLIEISDVPFEIGRIGTEADKDEAGMDFQFKLHQACCFMAEISGVFHMRCGNQATVNAVVPAMERATNSAAFTIAFQ